MYWIKTNPSLREKTRKFTFPFPQVLNWGVSISQQFLYIYIKFIPRKRKHSFVDGSILQAPQCHLGISFLWQLKKINIKNSVYECVSVQHVHAWGPWRPEEASGPPVSGVTVVSHHMAAGTQTQPGSS